MTVYTWPDRRVPNAPRVVMERGACGAGHCGQFSISISNGRTGMTVRFESEDEFRQFLSAGRTDISSMERPHQ